MDVRPGDILMMKKEHPCKNKEFLVLRAGWIFASVAQSAGVRLWRRAPKSKRILKKSFGKVPPCRMRKLSAD